MKSIELIGLAAAIVVIGLGVVTGFGGACTDVEASRRSLRVLGLRKVELHGYRFFGCSQHDVFRTAFRARSSDGEPVEGVVCCGLLKACTVRTD